MRGFKVDSDGDIILNKDIEITSDIGLIRQTIQTVLGTNKGEWFLNKDEGINFNNIIVKNPDYDVIRNEILQGIKQVDDSYDLSTFNYTFDKNNRTLKVDFTVRNNKNQTFSSSLNI